MPRKRVTPPDEFDRLAENIYNDRGHTIFDRKSYDIAFDKFFGAEKLTPAQNTVMRDEAWGFLKDRMVFTRAGGRNLDRDRQKTHRIVYNKDQQEQYIRHGAQRSDLRGVDTKQASFLYLGLSGRRKVFAQKTYVVVKNRKVVRYRDRRGRFVRRVYRDRPTGRTIKFIR